MVPCLMRMWEVGGSHPYHSQYGGEYQIASYQPLTRPPICWCARWHSKFSTEMGVLRFKPLPIGIPARLPGVTAELFFYSYRKWPWVAKVMKWGKGNMEEWRTNEVCSWTNGLLLLATVAHSLWKGGFWGTVEMWYGPEKRSLHHPFLSHFACGLPNTDALAFLEDFTCG